MDREHTDSRADFVLGSGAILFGFGMVIASLGLAGPTYDPLGPAFVPRALAVAIALCGAVILLQGFRKRLAASRAESAKDAGAAPSLKGHPYLALVSMVCVFLFILALDTGISGFRTLTILFVLVLGAALLRVEKRGFPRGHLLVLLGLSLALSFGLYYLFTRVFIVNLY